jgi:sugar phosphate permease
VSTSVSIVGIFLAGFLYDKASIKARLFLPLAFYTLTALGACGWYIYTSACLGDPTLRGRMNNPHPTETAIVVAFEIVSCLSLAAPSSYLDSIYVVEMAGKDGAAFGSGTIGGIGLLGGALASLAIGGETGTHAGWCFILKCFMGVAFTLVGLSTILALWGLRKLRREDENARLKEITMTSIAQGP